jgi:hypothetical protein
MKTMIPRNKMSKKARNALDRGGRNTWDINPVTRVRESGKAYNRNRYRQLPAE